MKMRSRSGQYVAIQSGDDPHTFQSWPIYFCPDMGHMMVLYKEDQPVYCTECEDDTEAWQPRGAEEHEPLSLGVQLAQERRARIRATMKEQRR